MNNNAGTPTDTSPAFTTEADFRARYSPTSPIPLPPRDEIEERFAMMGARPAGLRYRYESADGERVEISWSPNAQGSPPPIVVVYENDDWLPVADADAAAALLAEHGGAKIFRRVFDVPGIGFPHGEAGRDKHERKQGRLPTGTDKHGNPVSHTLPRRPVDPAICTQGPNGTWVHRDGEVTNAGGQPVITSERGLQRALDRTGMVHDRETFSERAPLIPAKMLTR